jgi:tRNA threonylcarbamoyladenosine biosynthesis protein TsaB
VSEPVISIAVETSCRVGGVALGSDDELLEVRDFDPDGTQASQLCARLDEIVRSRGLNPGDIRELYVSQGPGSYTGIRVGIAFARTLGWAIPDMRLVAVPTSLAVAENIADMDWARAGVLLAAKENVSWAILMERDENGDPRAAAPPSLAGPGKLVEKWGLPILLTGEGTRYCNMPGIEGIDIVDPDLHYPTGSGVWRVGRRMARRGEFTPAPDLMPLYARRPEAVRLWEKRGKELQN